MKTLKNTLMLGALLALGFSAYAADGFDTVEEVKAVMMSTANPADLANTADSIWNRAAITTLQARQEMPWGVKVPDKEFRYYVIPLRVNNEPLDDHRPLIFNELKERVKGKSMKDAILEVNHWCHEYVTYQPSDGRTHSPLQSMNSCIGRCGEESTFTVSALRSVGIPARQVYTPRWAHTDDNHAWVEAWADGEWHFLGACEPEPKLDLAWFNAPATRSMLMHTFVRGYFDGDDEIVHRFADGSNINVTKTYAPVATTRVYVVDDQGKPATDATVTFRIYNYCEFYPIATIPADGQGSAKLTTGLGDMLVWATDGKKFGFAKVTAGKDDGITISLEHDASTIAGKTFEFDVIPPPPGNIPVEVTAEERALNDERLRAEDAIRMGRIAKFMQEDEARILASKLGLPEDRFAKVMKEGRSNAFTLASFLDSKQGDERTKAFDLIESLSVKDRCDVPENVLEDHLSAPIVSSRHFKQYVLCPRIKNEPLTAWRRPLSDALKPMAAKCRANPERWVAYVKENVEIIPDWVPATVPINPVSVHADKKGSLLSRVIYFIAGARSMGIPARLDPVTGKLQYADASDEWQIVSWGDEPAAKAVTSLALTPCKENVVENPSYYYHFSLAAIDNGQPKVMEYPEETTLASFAEPVSLPGGLYMLTTGQRLANGGVLARVHFAQLEAGEEYSLPLVVRNDSSMVSVIGNFNSENRYAAFSDDKASTEDRSLLQTTGRGYYVLMLLGPGQEPTNHLLRDIASVKDELEATEVPMVSILEQSADPAQFFADIHLPQLAANNSYGHDVDGTIEADLRANMKIADGQYPVVVVADTFNRVVFLSQGYSINMGHQLLSLLKRI